MTKPIIRERSPHVRNVMAARAEARAGVIQTLNPISSGTWKLTEILTMIGFASDIKAAKKMLKTVKVNGEKATDKKYEMGELNLTVGEWPTVRVVGG